MASKEDYAKFVQKISELKNKKVTYSEVSDADVLCLNFDDGTFLSVMSDGRISIIDPGEHLEIEAACCGCHAPMICAKGH